MLEYIQEFGIELLMLFSVCIGVYVLENYSKKFLRSTINSLIQTAEANIKGSKLGEDKKAWVIAQLDASGIKLTKTVDKMIDELVKIMNKEKTSILDAVSKR